jgi:hypothetical protein
LLGACKPRSEPKPVVHDDARKAALVAIDAAGPPDAPSEIPRDGGVTFDAPFDLQGDIYRALDIAFDGKRPPLAYVGPGDQVAVFYYDTRSLYQPTACGYRVYKLATKKSVETLELVDSDMERNLKVPVPDATVATLKQRGAAIAAKIGGWQPLQLVRDWEGMPLKAKVPGGGTFVALNEGGDRKLELSDPVSSRLAFETIGSFDTKQTHQEDEATLACTYNPGDVSLYADAKRLLVGISYAYSPDCDDQVPTWRLWSLTERTN